MPIEADARVIAQSLEWTLWYLDELSRREGRMCFVATIIDFQGFSSRGNPLLISAFRRFFLEELVSRLKIHYCEHDSIVLIVNAPTIFRLVFSIVSAVLSKRQKDKIHVLGNVQDDSVRQALHTICPPETLPTSLGGSRPSILGLYPEMAARELEAWLAERARLEVAGAAKPPNVQTAAAAGPAAPGPAEPTQKPRAADPLARAQAGAAATPVKQTEVLSNEDTEDWQASTRAPSPKSPALVGLNSPVAEAGRLRSIIPGLVENADDAPVEPLEFRPRPAPDSRKNCGWLMCQCG